MSLIADYVIGAVSSTTSDWTPEQWVEEITRLKGELDKVILEKDYTSISKITFHPEYYVHVPGSFNGRYAVVIMFQRDRTILEELELIEEKNRKIRSDYNHYLTLKERFEDYVPE